MVDEQKPEPKTQEIPAADPIAIQLTELGRTIERGLARVEANQESQAHHLEVLEKEVRAYGDRLEFVEKRAASGSLRARAIDERTSVADLEHEAKIGLAIAKTQELEKAITETRAKVGTIETETVNQTVVLNKIAGILETPMMKRIGTAAGLLVLAVIGLAAAWVNGRSNAPTPNPQTIVIQQPATPDGGQ